MEQEELWYLDQDPRPKTQEERHGLLIQVVNALSPYFFYINSWELILMTITLLILNVWAKFVEGLLKDDRFHNTRWSNMPDISTWTIVTPDEVPKQNNL